MSDQIRPAAQADVDAMTTLAAMRREQYARRALRACGLEIASEWWVTPQPLKEHRGQSGGPV